MYLDLENKRAQYIKDLKWLGLKDDEIAELLNQYDEKMHRMKEMMEGDAEMQEEKLKKRLDKKRKGKDAGKQKIMKYNNQQRAVWDKYKDQIEEIEGWIMQKSDDVDDALINEKDQGEKEIEKKIQDKMVAFKDQFYKKLKAANGAQKQWLLGEHEKELLKL